MNRIYIIYSISIISLQINCMYLKHNRNDPESCDTVPTIFKYNPETIVTVHPELRDNAQSSRSLLKILPPLLEEYCKQRPTHDNCISMNIRYYDALMADTLSDTDAQAEIKTLWNLNNQPIRIHNLMPVVKEICQQLMLSPQTTHIIERACLIITHGQYIDRMDNNLSYNAEREKTNKHTLFIQLPTLLQYCLVHSKNYRINNDEYRINQFIKPLFYALYLKRDTEQYNLLSTIASFLKEYHNGEKNYISPQSTIRMAEEYCKLIHNQVSAPEHPYNEREEFDNFMMIIKEFPPTLKSHINNTLTWNSVNLIFAAHALRNPQWKDSLVNGSDIEWSIEYHLTLMDQYSASLAKKFIAIFSKPKKIDQSPLDMCYEQLKNRLCVTDATIENDLLKTLADIYSTLNNRSANTLLTIDAINNYFHEQLPHCPICFELFADHFNPDVPVGTCSTLPCQHSICSACILKLLSHSCPLCRTPIKLGIDERLISIDKNIISIYTPHNI